MASLDVRSVFQPVVRLGTGEVVGYEALARGRSPGGAQAPGDLFARARARGRVDELEWACRVAGAEGALEAGVEAPLVLFANIEPDVVTAAPAHVHPLLERAGERLRLVAELTERSLAWRPSELLRLVARVRELGWAVALDDVGQDPLALALLPVLQPEVVKLDLALARRRPDALTAQVVAAVAAYAERTGAVVVAEGLETPEHVQQALAMGATLGQGYLLGRPGPLERRPPAPARPLVLARPRPRPPGGSAFALVADRDVQRSTKPLLEAVSRHLEAQALTCGPMTVLLSALQHSRYFGARTAARYRRLASSASLVAVLGEGMSVHPTERVRGALLEPGDPLLQEWVVAVVNPHVTAALVAREVHRPGGGADDPAGGTTGEATGGPGGRASGPDAERVFEYVITYERELVLEVAARLLARVTHGPDGDPRSMASAVVGPVTDTTAAADAGGPDYRRAFTEAPVGMALVSPEGAVVRANRELELLLGRPAERLVGHDLPELARPDDAAALRAACRSAARVGRTSVEVRFTRPDGSVVPTTVALAPLGGAADDGAHLVLHVEDAGPRKALEAELSHRALHDPLTGLANRTLFRDRLAHALARARRAGDDTSVLFLDLDDFKAVNDEHGHHVGDAVLVQTAHRLQENLRPGDTAARWGGDEFTVLCEGAGAPAGAAVAARLVAALAQPLRVEGHVLVPGCSVGLASASELDDPLGEDELLRRADAAMYASKSARRL